MTYAVCFLTFALACLLYGVDLHVRAWQRNSRRDRDVAYACYITGVFALAASVMLYADLRP